MRVPLRGPAARRQRIRLVVYAWRQTSRGLFINEAHARVPPYADKRGAPSTFAPNQVIKGWTEAMQLMVQGDKWEMVRRRSAALGC